MENTFYNGKYILLWKMYCIKKIYSIKKIERDFCLINEYYIITY